MRADLATGACRLAFVEESTGSTEGLLGILAEKLLQGGVGGQNFQ